MSEGSKFSNHRQWWVAVAVGIIGATAAVTLLSLRTGSSSAAAPVRPDLAVTVSTSACARGWQPPPSGHPTFRLVNTTGALYDVELVGPDQLTVFGELEILAGHTTVPVRIALPPGRYSWRCTAADGTVSYSAPASVRGAAVADAHPYTPATYDQLAAATVVYRAEIANGLRVLGTETDSLRAAVASGQLDTARTRWLTAHLQYERLGAAYGTFGDFDARINGTTAGLPGGATDPHFIGFHRLELDLWARDAGSPGRVAHAVLMADGLDHDVHALAMAFPEQQTPPNDVALRTHEILENALQFEMTGATDEGSHTNLATVRANIDGTEWALRAIAPLLRSRNAALLASATSGLHNLAALLDRTRVNGTWTPVSQLARAQREQLDAALSALLERLSPIPDLLELPKVANDS